MKNINEVKIESTKGIPASFIKLVKDYAAREFNAPQGPNPQQAQRAGTLLKEILNAQRGHHQELSQIAEDLVRKYYGAIIEPAGVKLDLKVVNPDDKEKNEMVARMKQNPKEAEEELEMKYGEEIELGPEPDPDEVAKRKILNNIIQGEAQNVHSMIMDAKERINEISAGLAEKYLEFLNLNRTFDWMDHAQIMMSMPTELTNANEVEWEEENGEDKAKIKARGLDLPITIHEAVKGIYELIAEGAIDPDPVMAEKIMAQTDTTEDEREDIRFGPFIAGAVREYVNTCLERIEGAEDIPNIREFVFGEMVQMPADDFLVLMEAILTDDFSKEKVIEEFLRKIVAEHKDYQRRAMEYEFEKEDDKDDDKGGITELPPIEPKTPSGGVPKERKYVEMSQAELQGLLNKALDAEDYEKAHEISKYLRENHTKIVGETLFEYEVMTMPRTKEKEKEAPVKTPTRITPGTRPGAPTPIPTKRPSISPRPKATLDDVVQRFLKLVK